MPTYVRVLDKDTGHRSSVPESELPHGNYEVLDEAAVNPVTSDPLPVQLADPKSLSSKTHSGQQADPTKEKSHG